MAGARRRDPRFFTYVGRRCARWRPAPAQACWRLQSGRAKRLQALAAALVNDLGCAAGEIVLVLDDLPRSRVGAVDRGVAFLLDHQPPQLHLVVTARSDPHLPRRLRPAPVGGDPRRRPALHPGRKQATFGAP